VTVRSGNPFPPSIDNGKPGVRTDYAPNYCGAFLLDNEGNSVEAVCMR